MDKMETSNSRLYIENNIDGPIQHCDNDRDFSMNFHKKLFDNLKPIN